MDANAGTVTVHFCCVVPGAELSWKGEQVKAEVGGGLGGGEYAKLVRYTVVPEH